MNIIFKRITSLCMTVALCFGIAVTVRVGSNVFAAETDGYYKGITATDGSELLGQLHDLITTSRKKYSSYADCKNYGTTTDPGSKSNTVMEFYTHIDIEKSNWDVSGGWNREHVWPKSISNGLWNNETVGGGSDLHHIRPAEKDLNAKRGNLRYGTVKNGNKQYTSVSNVLGGYSTGSNSSGTFEPLDNVKGDVARIIMYVYTHYNTYTNAIFEGNAKTNGERVTGYQSSFFGTLNFKHIITATSESNAIELLLQWNKADPVDSIETARNEVVYGIQGNRNPFIDHPEYADAIWGDGSSTPEVPPSKPETPPSVPEVPPQETDTASVKAFRKAVAEVSEGTLAERFVSINAAVEAYGKLTDSDKVIAANDIETLSRIIASYNETVKGYNQTADSADETALKSICKLISAKESMGT